EIFVKCRVTRIRKTSQQKRIAVRRRIHDGLGGHISGGTRPILDGELLAEPLRQPLSYQACHDVVAPTAGKSKDDAYRARRIALRPRDARHGRQRASAGGEMQKISAGKFHFEPPSSFTSFNHLVGASK